MVSLELFQPSETSLQHLTCIWYSMSMSESQGKVSMNPRPNLKGQRFASTDRTAVASPRQLLSQEHVSFQISAEVNQSLSGITPLSELRPHRAFSAILLPPRCCKAQQINSWRVRSQLWPGGENPKLLGHINVTTWAQTWAVASCKYNFLILTWHMQSEVLDDMLG